MQAVPSPAPNDAIKTPLVRPPRLLIEWEPWARQFAGNLRYFLRPAPPPLRLTSRPAPFWPDVFVRRRAPWRSLASSALMHVAMISTVLGAWDLITRTVTVEPQDPLKQQTLTYYEVADYLPPVASESEPAQVIQKGEPEYAKQKIVSVPIGADNLSQTILNPQAPNILAEHVPLPNLVIATPLPQQPVSAAERSPNQITLPLSAITAMQPTVDNIARDASQIKPMTLSQPAAVEPTVAADAAQRRLGEMNMARVEPMLAEPQLPVSPQRASLVGASGQDLAVPPQPSLQAAAGGGLRAAGQLLALNVRPAAPITEIKIPAGSRLGRFAAGPEGRPGAPGTPDITAPTSGPAGVGTAPGAGAAGGNGLAIPGVSVAAGPLPKGPAAVVQGPVVARPGASTNGNDAQLKTLLASAARPAALGDMPRPGSVTQEPGAPSGTPEAKVFTGRKFYTLQLNMPNLTSAAGSWIVRFAELEAKPATPGELTAPVAMNKVDPAYPPELVDLRVEGVVVLYAVIRSTGVVEQIRVLQSVDERLDRNATRALARWKFSPATKNGVPVDLEAVVQIPFRVKKAAF